MDMRETVDGKGRKGEEEDEKREGLLVLKILF